MRVINIDELEWFQVKFQGRDEQCILIRKPHINNLNWFDIDAIKTAKWNWVFNRPYNATWGAKPMLLAGNVLIAAMG